MKYLRHLSLAMVVLFGLNACVTALPEGAVCTNVANSPLCGINTICDGLTAAPGDSSRCRQICDPSNGNADCQSGDSCVATTSLFREMLFVSVCRPN